MRILVAALMAAPLMLALSGHGARAQNYPWCLVKNEARSCGYVSFEQCMANRKVGSFCEQNFMARSEPEATAPRRKRR
jgi:uncharacterized protein DUF3551